MLLGGETLAVCEFRALIGSSKFWWRSWWEGCGGVSLGSTYPDDSQRIVPGTYVCRLKREIRSLQIHIYFQKLALFLECHNICGFLVSPRTIPAAGADDDDDDDNDETMHRHITKFGENTKQWHQRTPGLRVLPLASLVIIIIVAFGNVVVWVTAGVVLVNTNTPFFFWGGSFLGGIHLKYGRE